MGGGVVWKTLRDKLGLGHRSECQLIQESEEWEFIPRGQGRLLLFSVHMHGIHLALLGIPRAWLSWAWEIGGKIYQLLHNQFLPSSGGWVVVGIPP